MRVLIINLSFNFIKILAGKHFGLFDLHIKSPSGNRKALTIACLLKITGKTNPALVFNSFEQSLLIIPLKQKGNPFLKNIYLVIVFVKNKAIGLVADGLCALLTLQIILWHSAHERKQSIHG